jgi:uncharacterized LabA/DUF88 family protein
VSKNVAVFVDVANIFYAAKAAGVDIDYVTLLKAAVSGRDFVRAYAYTGLDPENENQRNFHAFLARHGYKVVSKDIRKYGDGKVKANLDIELVVDMMKTARNLDVAIVVSGDGDFAPAIRAVQEMGVRVEVISFRGNTSSDLMEVADLFTDITQIARVDRESSRSGRRVSGDDDDLSMTEVPDKQTEGRDGRRRRGGRGRGEAEASEPAGRSTGRVGRRVSSSGGQLVALPGEKLSRAPAAGAGADGVDGAEIEEAAGEGHEGEEAGQGEAGARRRRRRGGRGRGHGRSLEGTPGEPGSEEADVAEGESGKTPASRPNQFGSVWDSQIGMAGRPERLAPISPDEEDFAEPEIPEYLLAERRRQGGGRQGGGGGRGGRGTRSSYASAVDRERYGRSSTPYAQPARGPQQPRRRDERPQRQAPPQQHRGAPRSGGGRDSAEPWSEVPPELEEILRQQLSSKLSRAASGGAEAPAESTEAESKAPARRGTRRKAEASADGASTDEAPAKPAARSRRKAASSDEAAEGAEPAAPRRRAPARKKATAEAGTDTPSGE